MMSDHEEELLTVKGKKDFYLANHLWFNGRFKLSIIYLIAISISLMVIPIIITISFPRRIYKINESSTGLCVIGFDQVYLGKITRDPQFCYKEVDQMHNYQLVTFYLDKLQIIDKLSNIILGLQGSCVGRNQLELSRALLIDSQEFGILESAAFILSVCDSDIPICSLMITKIFTGKYNLTDGNQFFNTLPSLVGELLGGTITYTDVCYDSVHGAIDPIQTFILFFSTISSVYLFYKILHIILVKFI
jgi:hypothetical protein